MRKYVNGVRFADILDVWLFNYDGDIDLEAATTKEVAQVKWMNIDEIKEYLDAGKFVHTLTYIFDLL